MIDEEREASHRDHQKLHPEGVVVAVVRRLELHVDQVHCGVGAGDVDELHARETRQAVSTSRCLQRPHARLILRCVNGATQNVGPTASFLQSAACT